jgi:hypothetical protein
VMETTRLPSCADTLGVKNHVEPRIATRALAKADLTTFLADTGTRVLIAARLSQARTASEFDVASDGSAGETGRIGPITVTTAARRRLLDDRQDFASSYAPRPYRSRRARKITRR